MLNNIDVNIDSLLVILVVLIVFLLFLRFVINVIRETRKIKTKLELRKIKKESSKSFKFRELYPFTFNLTSSFNKKLSFSDWLYRFLSLFSKSAKNTLAKLNNLIKTEKEV